jgi:hypothetical protein
VPIAGPKKESWLFCKDHLISMEEFYQNFGRTEELFALLLVPMMPRNEILSAKAHPIIEKK